MPSDSAFDPSAHLTFGDVSVDQITDLWVLKVHSKQTPSKRVLMYNFVGKTGSELCPSSSNPT